jgi:hypothetical protein
VIPLVAQLAAEILRSQHGTLLAAQIAATLHPPPDFDRPPRPLTLSDFQRFSEPEAAGDGEMDEISG